jgi:hypothetical protein
MIMRALSGDFVPTRSSVCSIEGDSQVEPPPAPKTFTQDEVNRIAAKQKDEGTRAARAAAEAEFQAKEAAHLKRIEELELAGKTQAERDAIERRTREEADAKARKAREDALATERDQALAKATAAETKWKQDRVNGAVSNALVASKVIGSAASDAAHSFVRDSKIEVGDDGEILSVIYGGQSYTKTEDAAKAFLNDRPHFAQPSGTGGTGSRLPGAGGGGVKPLDGLTTEELLKGASEELRASQRR